MRDEEKTKDQLIKELVELCQRINELETAEIKRRHKGERLSDRPDNHRYCDAGYGWPGINRRNQAIES